MRQAVAIKASSTAATVNSTMVAELCPYACRHTPLLFATVHSLHTDVSRRIEGFLVLKNLKPIPHECWTIYPSTTNPTAAVCVEFVRWLRVDIMPLSVVLGALGSLRLLSILTIHTVSNSCPCRL
jgi:hypothetical protein